MPELPEVERVARTMAARVVGRRVAAVSLLRRDICESRRRGALVTTGPRELLRAAVIQSVLRHGKQLALAAADGRVLNVHLGMSGQLTWRAAPPAREAPHVHAVWRLADRAGNAAGEIVFRDPRRFGGLWTFDSLDEMKAARWSDLGPDALLVEAAELRRRLQGTTRSIKATLLDQAVLAGVGNIYADEALFRAGIRPRRAARGLDTGEVRRLSGAIRAVLLEAINAGGSTLRDFVDADSVPGGYQNSHAVYGRAGQPCRACGTRLRLVRIAQRATVFCPACQGPGAHVKPGKSRDFSTRTRRR